MSDTTTRPQINGHPCECAGVPAEEPSATQPLMQLTAREREVAGLMATDLSNQQIALALNISPMVAAAHEVNIKRKLQTRTRAEMLVMIKDAFGRGAGCTSGDSR